LACAAAAAIFVSRLSQLSAASGTEFEACRLALFYAHHIYPALTYSHIPLSSFSPENPYKLKAFLALVFSRSLTVAGASAHV
jgi:hypothetical protein